MKKVLLLDGNGLIFRAFYATFTRMTYNSNKVPTNAIYLFSSILLKIINQKDFDNILVALDSPGKKFRHEEYNEYKANRKEIPYELKAQFAPIKEFLEICNIKTIEIEGYEADDIIGTLALKALNRDIDLEIFTGDRDLLQLINDKATINMMHTGLSVVEKFNREHLMEVYNLTPHQIIDLKSLMGDSSDNIPGVKGIGEKTAKDLILKYQTLDNIYSNIEEIKGKLHDKLVEGKEMAYLSYDLATIYTNVPVDDSVLDETYSFYNEYKLYDFLKKYEIKSLYKYGKIDESNNENTNIKCNYEVVDKISKELLNENSSIYAYVDNYNYHHGNLIGLAISNINKTEFIYKDMLFFDFDLLDYLASNKISKNVYDYKKTYIILHNNNIELNNIKFDYLTAYYLYNQSLKDKNDIFKDYGLLIEPITKDSKQTDIELYSAKFAYGSILFKDKMIELLKEIDNLDLLYNIEIPLSKVLANMELNGVLVDVNLLNELDKEYSEKISELENIIYDLANEKFNINSPKQLAEILYDKLNLPSNKKKTTTADDLKYISKLHPIVNYILEYRKYTKLLNTYVDAFMTYKFSDNKIHSMFDQYSTMTGRLSSLEPNLQNLSIRDDSRKVIRKIIIAPKGYKILSLDYSQIELRILAMLSKDKNMIDAFNNNIDIHSMTASLIFDKDVSSITDNERRIAKATNFGIVYGISSFGLSEQIDCSMLDAKKIIDKFFISFNDVKKYLNDSIEFCQKNGYITTMFKRRRNVPEINSSSYNTKEFGKRVAMNSPIQGSAADIMKLAMIKVNDAISKYNNDCKLVCQIHDELIFEVKEEIADEVKEIVKDIMENVCENKLVKLKVSYSIGNNWMEAK